MSFARVQTSRQHRTDGASTDDASRPHLHPARNSSLAPRLGGHRARLRRAPLQQRSRKFRPRSGAACDGAHDRAGVRRDRLGGHAPRLVSPCRCLASRFLGHRLFIPEACLEGNERTSQDMACCYLSNTLVPSSANYCSSHHHSTVTVEPLETIAPRTGLC